MIDLRLGDCLEVMPTIPSGSVDAVVTDPPAGIGFMGRTWDKPKGYGFTDGGNRLGEMPPDATRARNPSCRQCGGRQRAGPKTKPCVCGKEDWNISDKRLEDRNAFVAFLSAVLAECYRIAKPGSRLLCWAIPRTSHWTGLAIEDAGWLIEDRVAHIFGQGFPKAKSKLKPAVEDWWMARKPGRGVPELNIDACRISTTERDDYGRSTTRADGTLSLARSPGYGLGDTPYTPSSAGRWPANLTLSHSEECRCVGTKRVKTGTACEPSPKPMQRKIYGETNTLGRECGYADPDGLETVAAWECVEGCPILELDRQSGERPGGYRRNPSRTAESGRAAYGSFEDGHERGERGYDDLGGASRFFATFGYFPKASRANRGQDNRHPTVKNTDMMRWLCRLIVPEGGIVLDPFMGSGSTLIAAEAEGFSAIGIDSDPESVATARRRWANKLAETPLFSQDLTPCEST